MIKRIKKYPIFAIIIIFCLLCPIFIFVSLHIEENIKLNKFITDRKLDKLKISKESAIIISDSVKSYFNSDITKWKTTEKNFNKMPYFRHSVLDMLKSHEAVCGGGTRFLTRILIKLGYNATRILLLTSNFGSRGHSCVSMYINGREYFIDSINGGIDIETLFRNYDIGTIDLMIIPYSKRYDSVYLDAKYNEDTNIQAFQKKFTAYSYEALPFSKILNTVKFNVYVLNFHRPSVMISYIAESVYLLYALCYLTFFLFNLVLIFNILALFKKIFLKKRG